MPMDPLLRGLFLLGSHPDRLLGALSSSGIGLGSLSSHRQTFAMAEAAEAPNIHEPFNIHRDLFTKIALHFIFPFDRLS
jgi:hypothetical protein